MPYRGLPIREWKLYTFDPQPDITVYELALCAKMVSRLDKTFQLNRVFVHVTWAPPEWKSVARHFKLTGETAEDVTKEPKT